MAKRIKKLVEANSTRLRLMRTDPATLKLLWRVQLSFDGTPLETSLNNAFHQPRTNQIFL